MAAATPSRLSRRLFAVLALGQLAFLGGCLGWEPAKFTETRTLSLAHMAGKAVDVQTDNGAITLTRGQTSEVTIVASLKATTQERLDAAVVDASRDVDGKLVVRVLWPEKRKDSEGCAFQITMPDAVGVSLVSSNGALAVSGMAGGAVLKTSNGAIQATSHDGPVLADTSNGRIELNSCSGGVDADTSNGAITLVDVGSPIRADTSNGAIKVVMLPTAVGPLDLGSSNGSIEAFLSPAFAGRLNADTSNGRVTFNGMDKGRIQSLHKSSGVLMFGSVPAQGGESRIDTSNGSVTVQMRGQ